MKTTKAQFEAPMKELFQIHHQFKDGRTEFLAQKEVTSHDDFEAWWAEVAQRHPLSDGVQWMICNQNSEHFIKTTEEVPA